MKPTKGLHKDLRPENQPDGTYFFGKNGMQYDREGSITNEPGFEKFLTSFVPNGFVINGILSTDSSRVLVFSTNDTDSAIQLVNLGTRTVDFLFNDSLKDYSLGFKAVNYITGEVQRNYKGELVCAFTDKNTFPKFINLDNPETSSLNSWNLFPQYEEPTLSTTVLPGGFIDVGSHFLALRYFKLDGTRTAFTRVGSGVIITSSDGTEVADKAIQIQITNQDLSYAYMEVAVISKVKGVTSAIVLDKVPVTGGTYTLTYTGDNSSTAISLEEILTPQVNYDSVGTMTQLNDSLYIGDLHNELDMLDLQPYANLIDIKWRSELIDIANLPDEHLTGARKSMKHGEVYAIYVRYRGDGRYSPWYHIPGVPVPAAALASSAVSNVGNVTAPIYKVEDVITNYDPNHYMGITGPYQNSTEKYPPEDAYDSSALGGEDLRSQFVRHHKMPSVKFCKEKLYASEIDYGKTRLDILGIEASNIVIPDKYAALIDGYEIGYAKRTIQNATIYSQGLLLYGAQNTNTNATEFYSTGHNFTADSYVPTQGNLRFHGLDLLLNKPAVKPSHISAQLKITVNVECMYSRTSYPTNAARGSGKMTNVHKSDVFGTGVVTTLGTNNINGIAEPRYVKVNSKVDDYNNKYLETVFEGKLQGAPLPFNQIVIQNYTVPVETFLVDLCDIKQDVYSSFYAQELVSAGAVIPINQVRTVWGGDIFISLYTFHTYGAYDDSWEFVYNSKSNYAEPHLTGRRVVHRFICETVANHNARYEDTGNEYTKWFDNNTLTSSNSQDGNAYPIFFDGRIDPNQIQIVKGAEGINDFVTPHIFTPYRDYITDFPYRVHRGGKLDRQNSQRSWRTFLALDYYECQKDKGFIVNLEGMDDKLLIHHKNALFATRDKAKLESGLLGVTIGTGDIFELEPQELQASKLGYAGTQHDLAAIRTPVGYIFPDAKQGEIFLYVGGQLKKLNSGLNNFFRKYLPILGNNPFVGNGITIGWDHQHKRMLVTVKNSKPLDSVLHTWPPTIRVFNTVEELEATVGSLRVGEVVFINNKYMKFQGLNPSGTGFDCPADIKACPPPTDLVFTINSAGQATVFWTPQTGVSGYNHTWELYAADTNTLIASDTQPNAAVVIVNAAIALDTLYEFRVRTNCSFLGSSSLWVNAYDVLLTVPPPPPVPSPPASVVIGWSSATVPPAVITANINGAIMSSPYYGGMASGGVLPATWPTPFFAPGLTFATVIITLSPQPATIRYIGMTLETFSGVYQGVPSNPYTGNTGIGYSTFTFTGVVMDTQAVGVAGYTYAVNAGLRVQFL